MKRGGFFVLISFILIIILLVGMVSSFIPYTGQGFYEPGGGERRCRYNAGTNSVLNSAVSELPAYCYAESVACSSRPQCSASYPDCCSGCNCCMDCNSFQYLNLGGATTTLGPYTNTEPIDWQFYYSCQSDYGLVNVYAHTFYVYSIGTYYCRYIGSGGSIVTKQSVYNAADHSCIFDCPDGYALRSFTSVDAIDSSLCKTFTCQQVTYSPCIPWTCEGHYYPLGQCGNNLDNNCGGKIDCNSCPSGGPCCSGSCCSSGQVCHATTQACCTPSCVGKECGDNGCGVSCGSCTLPETCLNGQCIVPTDSYWTNMKNEKIGVSVSKSADLNDLVKLVFVITGVDLTDKTLEYEIYKTNKWWFDSKQAQGTNTGYTVWRAGKNAETGGLESGTYYFKVRIQGETVWYQSSNLVVSATENNAPPTAIIVSPVMDSKYKINTEVSFDGTVADEDDDLKVIWGFGDGNIQTIENCLTGGNCDTTHTYSSKGTKIINLTAEEIGRNQKAIDYSRAFIYDTGTNVFAKILYPELGKIYDSPVDFDASESYVSVCQLGSCPSGKTCYPVGDLYCYDLLKSDIPGVYDLRFDWVYGDGNTKSGKWSVDYYKVVKFKKAFILTGNYKSDLKVSSIGGSYTGSDETYTIFNVQSGSIGEVDYCEDYDNAASCNNDNSGVGKRSVELIHGNNFCGSTINDPDNSNCIFLISKCGCEWDTDNSKCIPTFEKTKSCDGGGGGGEEGICAISTTGVQGDCERGDDFVIYTWINEWVCDGDPIECEAIRDPECDDQTHEKKVMCENIPKLSFFNLTNFIISIFVLVVMYFLLLKKDDK